MEKGSSEGIAPRYSNQSRLVQGTKPGDDVIGLYDLSLGGRDLSQFPLVVPYEALDPGIALDVGANSLLVDASIDVGEHLLLRGVDAGPVRIELKRKAIVKIHLITTAAGNPGQFSCTPGSCDDMKVLKQMSLNLPEGAYLYADAAHTNYGNEEDLLAGDGV